MIFYDIIMTPSEMKPFLEIIINKILYNNMTLEWVNPTLVGTAATTFKQNWDHIPDAVDKHHFSSYMFVNYHAFCLEM